MRILLLIWAILIWTIAIGQIDGQFTGEGEYTFEKEMSTQFTEYDSNFYNSLPPSVDLSYLMPPAGNQGYHKGSCWAWASTYCIRSLMDNTSHNPYHFIKDGKTNLAKIYSPEYVYQKYKNPEDDCEFSSAYAAEILSRILMDGVVSYSAFPYDSIKCNIDIPDSLINLSKSYAVNYIVHFTHDIASIKKVLSDSQAVIISIKLDDNFHKFNNLNSDTIPIWNTYGKRRGYHAMVIVGYDDSLQALKVLNSFGKSFGSNGYIWISYSIAGAAMQYCCYPGKGLRELPTLAKIEPQEQKDKGSGISPKTRFLDTTTWFKPGYFRLIDDYKIALVTLDKKQGFAVVEIRDSENNFKTSFYIDNKTSKEFYVDNKLYKFTFNNIGRAGRNKTNWAVYFTLRRE